MFRSFQFDKLFSSDLLPFSTQTNQNIAIKKRFDRSKKRAKKNSFFEQFKSDFNGFYITAISVLWQSRKKMFKIKNQFQAMHSMRSMWGKVSRHVVRQKKHHSYSNDFRNSNNSGFWTKRAMIFREYLFFVYWANQFIGEDFIFRLDWSYLQEKIIMVGKPSTIVSFEKENEAKRWLCFAEQNNGVPFEDEYTVWNFWSQKKIRRVSLFGEFIGHLAFRA